MSAGADAFFESVFNVRTYARLMGGDAGCEPAGCGSGECGSGAADEALALEARGGTALYHRPSFVNHDCDPNLSAVMGPFGALQLVTRRPVPAGEELSITYLDSSLPVNVRRGKLHHGYGFECGCAMCSRQMKELQAAKAVEARAARSAAIAADSQQQPPQSTPQQQSASLR